MLPEKRFGPWQSAWRTSVPCRNRLWRRVRADVKPAKRMESRGHASGAWVWEQRELPKNSARLSHDGEAANFFGRKKALGEDAERNRRDA